MALRRTAATPRGDNFSLEMWGRNRSIAAKDDAHSPPRAHECHQLPYIVSWQDIKDLFRDAGSVVRADVHQAPDGRPKGTGVVIFETEEDAKKAIETFNGYEWHGRKIEVREDKFAGSGPPPRSWGPPRGGGWGGWYGPSPYGPPPYG